MSNNVTDRLLLKEIHDTYYSEFCKYDKTPNSRSSKIYVPIDCEKIAKKFNLEPDIIYGRLYYHLDKKYGYKKDDGSMVHLFAKKSGEDWHTVHFPMLSAVLAELEQSYFRFTIPLFLSTIAMIISIVSFIRTF